MKEHTLNYDGLTFKRPTYSNQPIVGNRGVIHKGYAIVLESRSTPDGHARVITLAPFGNKWLKRSSTTVEQENLQKPVSLVVDLHRIDQFVVMTGKADIKVSQAPVYSERNLISRRSQLPAGTVMILEKEFVLVTEFKEIPRRRIHHSDWSEGGFSIKYRKLSITSQDQLKIGKKDFSLEITDMQQTNIRKPEILTQIKIDPIQGLSQKQIESIKSYIQASESLIETWDFYATSENRMRVEYDNITSYP